MMISVYPISPKSTYSIIKDLNFDKKKEAK
jgi:hypothetical protein